MISSTRYLLSIPSSDAQYTDLKVIVHESQSYCIHSDRGIEFPIQNVTLYLSTKDSKSSKSVELCDINHAPPTLFESLNESADIHFYFDKNKISTFLPREMNSNLIKFLKLGKPSNPDYCCINFSYELLYGRGVIKDDNSVKSFHAYTFQEEKIKTGTIAYFYKTFKTEKSSKQINQHFAIYIGENYYLSLHGANGCLAISNSSSIKEYCQGGECMEVKRAPELIHLSKSLGSISNPLELESKYEPYINSKKEHFKLSKLSFFAVTSSVIVGCVSIGAILTKMQRP
jgi:hypothetical protein